MKYLKELMKKKHMTCAELCRESDLSESTVRGILNDKVRIELCKTRTLYEIAKVLDVTVEDILDHYWEERFHISSPDFPNNEQFTMKCESALYLYKAIDSALNWLKDNGDGKFLKKVLADKIVQFYYNKGKYGSALFVAGVMDYLCRKQGLQPVRAYVFYRRERLDHPVFPLRLMNVDMDGQEYEACKQEIMENAIPELAHFNIYMTEDDLRLKS